MALFHLRSKIIGRKSGRSVVAAAAYRSGDCLYDERRKQEQDYTKKTGIVYSEIMTPDHAPARFRDRQTLWNEVEHAEKRKDAQLAREVEVALPRELSEADQIALVRQFVRENFVSEGMIADFSIHAPTGSDGKTCPHAHILLTLREVSPEGFGKKQREWNASKDHEAWRASWEELTNRKLSECGIDARIDRRSYVERSIDLEPQIKEGAAHQITRKMQTKDPQAEADLSAENRRIRARNWYRMEHNPQIITDALTDRASTFTRQDLARFLHRYSDVADHQAMANMMARVLGHSETVRLGRDQRGNVRYSTAKMLETESQLVEMAEAMRGDRSHSATVATSFPVQCGAIFLSQEQTAAVVHITGRERLALVSGLAGGGKTTMLDCAHAAWRQEGYEVHGLALSASAAAQLEEGSRIPSRTIAGFLRGIEKGRERIGDRTVLVVDEAGMVGSRQMRDILSVAQQAGAKVVLVGDGEQLQAIEAGAPFRKLEEHLGSARLVESRRARDAGDRAATVALGGGRTREGLEHYDQQGALVEVATASSQIETMARSYLADAAEIGAENVLVLAHRRVDIRRINRAIRAGLVEACRVEAGLKFMTVNGEREFGAGDRIVFLKNDNGLGVRNGLDGVVESVSGTSMRIRTRDRTVEIDPAAYGHIDHGYARTLHKGQGATAERVHVALSDTLDRQLSYVAFSRHRERVRAYWTPETVKDKAVLFERMCRDRRKDMALDYGEARGIDPEEGQIVRRFAEVMRRRQQAQAERLARAAEAMRKLREEEEARRASEMAAQRAEALAEANRLQRLRYEEALKMERERLKREDAARKLREEEEARRTAERAEAKRLEHLFLSRAQMGDRITEVGLQLGESFRAWEQKQGDRMDEQRLAYLCRNIENCIRDVECDLSVYRTEGAGFLASVEYAVARDRTTHQEVIAGMHENGSYARIHRQMLDEFKANPKLRDAYERLEISLGELNMAAQGMNLEKHQLGLQDDPNAFEANKAVTALGGRLEKLPSQEPGQSLLQSGGDFIEKIVHAIRNYFAQEREQRIGREWDAGPSRGR